VFGFRLSISAFSHASFCGSVMTLTAETLAETDFRVRPDPAREGLDLRFMMSPSMDYLFSLD
jgi:hypothetical protein